ncbi:hypothetical protein LJK88_27780 [Paenibacillus sp. P26]|nr:hypothetical protein LJK88_27780 [Paenibacillus sp. P26]
MIEITVDLVRRLIESQFPEWKHLDLRPVEKSGHDNRTYRLGSEMTVRLPCHERYASAVEKEWTWLPVFKPLLSLPIPVPVAKGSPRTNIRFLGPSTGGLTAPPSRMRTYAI